MKDDTENYRTMVLIGAKEQLRQDVYNFVGSDLVKRTKNVIKLKDDCIHVIYVPK